MQRGLFARWADDGEIHAAAAAAAAHPAAAAAAAGERRPSPPHGPVRASRKRRRGGNDAAGAAAEYEDPAAAPGGHRRHPDGWSSERHYGMCGQSCPCCRAHVDGDTIGACPICLERPRSPPRRQTNGQREASRAAAARSPPSPSFFPARLTRSAATHLGMQNSRDHP